MNDENGAAASAVLAKDISDRLAKDISDRAFQFLIFSGCLLLAGIANPTGGFERLLLGAGLGLFSLAAAGWGIRFWTCAGLIRDHFAASRALRREVCPAILTDACRKLLDMNPTAADRVGRPVGKVIDGAVSEAFGLGSRLPSRMARVAAATGTSEETACLNGSRIRVRVSRISSQRYLWSFDQRGEAVEAATAADSVAMVSLAPDGQIVGGNALAADLLREASLELTDRGEARDTSKGRIEDLESGAGSQGTRIVQLNNSAGWREVALVPGDKESRPVADKILAEPGLLEALPVPMLKIAVDGTLIEANKEARSILCISEGPLPPLFELVEGMGRPISDWLSDAGQGRGLLKPEIVRSVTAGQELFLQITLGRTVDEGVPVLVGILNDATELKTLEAQFVQSQKMQAIGQLAGGVAHDFNNLLTAISGHCDLLLLRHDPGDPEFADLIQISQNANRAASLVGQLLAFSRKQNLKAQALDLRDTMSDLAHLLNRLIGERIKLEVIHSPGPQVIRADRRQLEQVIINLVVNARDAMPEGGKITITTRERDLATELVRDRAHVLPGRYVVIEVQDTGTGISNEGLTKIFEPFYTTKKTGEGTGLGLSTAYGIVKQTGGFIFVDSTLGEGTVFTLYFPATDAVEVAEPERSSEIAGRTAPSAGGVVLLVEDEAPVRAFASRALRLRGYTVLEAENAEQALKTLEDRDLQIDVFVTDVIMPGLDGPTWVGRALEDRPETRTVFMSGYSEEGRAEKQSRIPNSVFLPKPFSLQQLTSVVNDQLQRQKFRETEAAS